MCLLWLYDMLPSDIAYFENCYLEKEQNRNINKSMANWRLRKGYLINNPTKKNDFYSFLDIRDLMKMYGYEVNGKRLCKTIGKKKYEILPRIRKQKETIQAKKDGTWDDDGTSHKSKSKIYHACDFPIPGLAFGGHDLLIDPQNLTDKQYNYCWISDEEGELTILDVGQYTTGKDGLLYDSAGIVKKSKPITKNDVSPEEWAIIRKERRKAVKRKSYQKHKEKYKVQKKVKQASKFVPKGVEWGSAIPDNRGLWSVGWDWGFGAVG
jgi:hypothetical protein